jgi:hypothetical protein
MAEIRSVHAPFEPAGAKCLGISKLLGVAPFLSPRDDSFTGVI